MQQLTGRIRYIGSGIISADIFRIPFEILDAWKHAFIKQKHNADSERTIPNAILKAILNIRFVHVCSCLFMFILRFILYICNLFKGIPFTVAQKIYIIRISVMV